ncbi:MAG: AraC family transcriptional regulator [Methylacidiphilales bacterium]|nr:AraC family transcriptional regulator [Candidatus Methylacidiphilales bacterium]
MGSRRLPSSRLVFRQKDFQLPGMVMFGRYQHAAAQIELFPHFHHEAIEICFLERGEQTYRVKGLAHRLHGNDQFFTLPGEIHDTAKLPQERGILYWLILKLDPARKFLGLSETQARRLKRELYGMPTRHFRGHPDCARILGEINDILVKERKHEAGPFPFRQLRLQALLLQYLTLTIRASHQGLHGAASPLMQRVLHYIDAHLNDPIQVSLLAQVAGLSESRCKIRFKREIGVPPAEFWLRKKIEKAVLLLKSRSVTEVAFELGFSSSQYFATVFKRYTLVNPSQFHHARVR